VNRFNPTRVRLEVGFWSFAAIVIVRWSQERIERDVESNTKEAIAEEFEEPPEDEFEI
jgi:hypothetical protein